MCTDYDPEPDEALDEELLWRVGRKVPINVYEGNRPVCQCHTAIDAKRIVDAMNAHERSKRKA